MEKGVAADLRALSQCPFSIDRLIAWGRWPCFMNCYSSSLKMDEAVEPDAIVLGLTIQGKTETPLSQGQRLETCLTSLLFRGGR